MSESESEAISTATPTTAAAHTAADCVATACANGTTPPPAPTGPASGSTEFPPALREWVRRVFEAHKSPGAPHPGVYALSVIKRYDSAAAKWSHDWDNEPVCCASAAPDAPAIAANAAKDAAAAAEATAASRKRGRVEPQGLMAGMLTCRISSGGRGKRGKHKPNKYVHGHH